MLQDSVKNIFAVPELRKRVLFTLGMLAVYRVGSHVTIPGINKEALAILAEQARNTMFGLYDMFSGAEPVADDGVRAGHHALHQRVDHPAAADGGVAVPGAPLEGGRARAAEDHAVHALRHHRAGFVQAFGIALFLERSTEVAGGIPLVYQPGLELPAA